MWSLTRLFVVAVGGVAGMPSTRLASKTKVVSVLVSILGDGCGLKVEVWLVDRQTICEP